MTDYSQSEYNEPVRLPPAEGLRESGGYALVDGVWWPSSRPLNGKDAVLSQQTTCSPALGFRPGIAAGISLRRVAASRVEQFARVMVTVAVDGMRPFVVNLVDPPVVQVTYGGFDRDAAAALEGVSIGDWYQDGGDVFGSVDMSRVSDVVEEVTLVDIG